ncbi:MAG: right-handed parallel beta-helix repeat-containing protein [Chloroflexota bacterium]
MDGRAFDRLTRLLAGKVTRRAGAAAAVAGIAGAAGIPGPAGAEEKSGKHGSGHGSGKSREQAKTRRPGAAGPCGDGSDKANQCAKAGDCCTGICDRAAGKTTGRCRCVRAGKKCGADRNCCSGRSCVKGTCARQKPPRPPVPQPVDTGEACSAGSVCKASAASCTTYALGVMTGTYCLLPAAAACQDDDDCVSSFCNGGSCEAACTVCASGCPKTSVSAALAAASADGVIGVGPGTYDDTVEVDKSITVRRCGSAGTVEMQTTTPGKNVFRVLNLDATLTLKDLELTGNDAARRPLVYLDGNLSTRPKLSATGVIFRDLVGDSYGAVVAYERADIELTECEIRNNTDLPRGAVTVKEYCTLTVKDCVFDGNIGVDSYDGAGIHAYSSTAVTIDGCTFTNNDALGYNGGAVHVDGGALIIKDSTFTGNKADMGGALSLSSDDGFEVTDCTFSGNTATSAGGGILIDAASGILTRVKVTGNTVEQAGQAFKNGGGVMVTGYGRSVVFTDCEISGNTHPRAGGGMHVFAGSIGKTTIIFAGSTTITGNTVTDGTNGGGSGLSVLQDTGSSQTVAILGSRTRVTGNDTPPTQCARANGFWPSITTWSGTEVTDCIF